MTGLFALVALVSQSSPNTLSYQDGAFLVGGSGNTVVVPIRQPATDTAGLDRKNQRWSAQIAGKTLTFDSNGLTIAQGAKKSISRLSSVPTSGKIATKESNEALLKLVADGVRRLEVTALSGVEIIGTKAYLLARWEDKSRNPWLEALLVVDLADAKPQASLIDRLPGFSYAVGLVDDVLAAREDELWALSQKGSQFSLAKFKVGQPGPPAVVPLGPTVERARISPSGRYVWTHTSTRQRTVMIGYADIETQEFVQAAEVRGQVTGFFEPAYSRVKTAKGTALINLFTGAQWEIAADAAVRQTSAGLLVWAPSGEPKRATLHDPHGRVVSLWAQASPPSPPRGG
ncbi:MAG: hypothetical protein KF884_10220 [Fimbriimonadaceae bacterium]|nr:hypothetical protein [Fimbriimonadaceae bacterium]QYK57922.1 MAG: hypothetical protein KF884_10220 [Fimbriimonadaceae bacterium]